MIRIPHFPGCVNPFFEKRKNNKEKALRPSLSLSRNPGCALGGNRSFGI